jgi:hypothetical protein
VESANVTLSYPMPFGTIIDGVSTVNISDVMNIKAGSLCYDYA